MAWFLLTRRSPLRLQKSSAASVLRAGVRLTSIGVTAAAASAVLLTRNARDFGGIPDLDLEAVS
jgi:predicted nucleic acid-binding protein